MANSGIPLEQWSGSAATNKLHESILEIDKKTNEKTNLIIGLTIASLIVSVVGVIISILK